MPRRTRAELEAENGELRGRLETIHDELSDYFDDSDDSDESEESDDDQDGGE